MGTTNNGLHYPEAGDLVRDYPAVQRASQEAIDARISELDEGLQPVRAATDAREGGTLVKRRRDGGSNHQSLWVAEVPKNTGSVTHKGYVDDAVWDNRFAGYLDGIDLDEVLDPGLYGLNAQANATTALNYPAAGIGGTLLVMRWAGELGGHRAVTQMYQGRGSTERNRLWIRSKITSTWVFSSWVELANTDLATSSADGLMSYAHYRMLDNATYAQTASRLVQRDSSGRARFNNPAHDEDAANKGYVDGLIDSIGGGGWTPPPWTDGTPGTDVTAGTNRYVRIRDNLDGTATIALNVLSQSWTDMDAGTLRNLATFPRGAANLPPDSYAPLAIRAFDLDYATVDEVLSVAISRPINGSSPIEILLQQPPSRVFMNAPMVGILTVPTT